jgi:hypothetical protein
MTRARWIKGGDGVNDSLSVAARRVVRDFNRDMNVGGLITPQTQIAVEILQRALERDAPEIEQEVEE